MIPPGAQVHGFTVQHALDVPVLSGPTPPFRELVAVDPAGARVIFRVPADTEAAARLRLEHQVAKQHAHESILASVGILEHAGRPIQVVEHVDGMSLSSLCEAIGPLPPAAVCRVGRLVALALVELHDRANPVAHGALAADRVLIDGGGNVRLLDVGRAHPEGPERARSPERRLFRADPSPGDDLYALGVLLADAAAGVSGPSTEWLQLGALRGTLPERLVDALAVLLAPIDTRLKSASAAVRIFTELEKRFGDGTAALRRWLIEGGRRKETRRDDAPPAVAGVDIPADDPPTVTDGGIVPIDLVTLRRPGPLLSPPRTASPARGNPATVELDRRMVLDVDALQRLSVFAEEAARRRLADPSLPLDAPAPLPGPATLELPLLDDAFEGPSDALSADERRAARSGLRFAIGALLTLTAFASAVGIGLALGTYLFRSAA